MISAAPPPAQEADDTVSEDATFYDCASVERNGDRACAQSESAAVHSSTSCSGETAAAGVATTDQQQQQKGGKPYSRKVAPKGKAQKDEVARRQFVSQMQAYFSEVGHIFRAATSTGDTQKGVGELEERVCVCKC